MGLSVQHTCRSNAPQIDAVSEAIGCTQGLKNAFEPILNIILVSLDAAAVFMRTKALRALGQIVLVDPTILRNVCWAWRIVHTKLLTCFAPQTNVRKAIENHLQDSSPAVRDAAVELIGKYIISMPAVAGDYFQQIAERIAVSVDLLVGIGRH